MINPQYLELPMSWTNFHGPKDVRTIEVRLYAEISKAHNTNRWQKKKQKKTKKKTNTYKVPTPCGKELLTLLAICSFCGCFIVCVCLSLWCFSFFFFFFFFFFWMATFLVTLLMVFTYLNLFGLLENLTILLTPMLATKLWPPNFSNRVSVS